MKKYKALLFDLDDTILSFGKAEEYALNEICKYYGILPTKENIDLYKQINLNYWHKLERKEVTREYLLKQRFIDYFDRVNVKVNVNDINTANDLYFKYLTSKVFYIDGALDAIRKLKEKYKIYIITNGVKLVQEKRLNLANDVKELAEYVFISEEIGNPKPTVEFMNFVLDKIKFLSDENQDIKVNVNICEICIQKDDFYDIINT